MEYISLVCGLLQISQIFVQPPSVDVRAVILPVTWKGMKPGRAGWEPIWFPAHGTFENLTGFDCVASSLLKST